MGSWNACGGDYIHISSSSSSKSSSRLISYRILPPSLGAPDFCASIYGKTTPSRSRLCRSVKPSEKVMSVDSASEAGDVSISFRNSGWSSSSITVSRKVCGVALLEAEDDGRKYHSSTPRPDFLRCSSSRTTPFSVDLILLGADINPTIMPSTS